MPAADSRAPDSHLHCSPGLTRPSSQAPDPQPQVEPQGRGCSQVWGPRLLASGPGASGSVPLRAEPCRDKPRDSVREAPKAAGLGRAQAPLWDQKDQMEDCRAGGAWQPSRRSRLERARARLQPGAGGGAEGTSPGTEHHVGVGARRRSCPGWWWPPASAAGVGSPGTSAWHGWLRGSGSRAPSP